MRNKGKAGDRLLFAVLLGGLALLVYPALSNSWNAFHQTRAVSRYAEETASVTGDRYRALFEAAEEYNRRLAEKEDVYSMTDEELAEYASLLNPTGNGMMGYLEIPSIGVTLPVYHGTSEPVLAVGVGHIEWSSLPTGGEGTHAVLSGHRGLPSSYLLTDMDKVEVGDLFRLCILREAATYEVDRIFTVVPEDTGELTAEAGQDYCSIVTCTPYAVNTHRLVVRGRRTEVRDGDVRLTAEAARIDPLYTAPVLALPLLILLFCGVLFLPIPTETEREKIKARLLNGELPEGRGNIPPEEPGRRARPP